MTVDRHGKSSGGRKGSRPPSAGRRPVVTRPTNGHERQSWRASRGFANVLALTDDELRLVDENLEHQAALKIGSRAEIAVLSALTRRYDAVDTDGCLAIFDMIDSDRNGFLTKEELRRGVRAKYVREYVAKTKNVTLKGLLKEDRKRFDAVFREIDRSDVGVITKADFVTFVKKAAQERVRYMRVVGLLKRRCYWGLGLQPANDDDVEVGRRTTLKKETTSCCRRCCVACCCWCYPKGYCEDFWFYVKNNHPYLALFSRDEAHPFSRRDAFGAELIKQCYCLAASVYVDRLERPWRTPSGALFNWKLSILFVALPSMVIDELLFLFLACPCLRFERRGRRREACFAKAESCGDCLGRLVVVPLALVSFALIAFALYVFYTDPRAHANFALFWVLGLLSEYFITWPLYHLVFHFNLLWPDCAAMPCFGCFKACCGLWHFFNCGRWATERRLAADIALREDDDEYFNTFYRL